MNETVNEADLGKVAPVSHAGASAQGADGKRGNTQQVCSIVVAATFTADPIIEPLRFWAETLELPAQFALAPYGQLLQELINPHSLLSQNLTGCNFLLIRPEDWIRDRIDHDVESNIEHLRSVAAELVRGVTALRARTRGALIVFFCPTSSALASDYALAVATVNNELTHQLSELAQLHCLSYSDVADLYPALQWEDVRTDRIAHIPYTDEYFVALATLFMRRAAVLLKPAYKVIAIDCDNTLWSGICGEVGAAGVQLTPAHLELQRNLVRQHDAGVLLCLCSKNNIADVNAVFAGNPQMPLRQEHLICSRINWQPKSENLRSIAQELELGLDSFILLDDSAMECAEVRANCPQVLTLQVPTASNAIYLFLKHCWVFDRLSPTQDARRRTAQYRENRSRREAQQHATDLESFLASLQLIVDVEPMQPTQLPRVAELIQRTNQFNLTAIRRRASEIEALWSTGDIRVIVVHARDRFGDYGLVGSVFFRRVADVLEIDTWVLSCRALGRGVEHRIVNELGSIAGREGAGEVRLKFRRTPRNAPAGEFLHRSFSAFRSKGSSDEEQIFSIPTAYAINFTVSAASRGDAEEPVASSDRPFSVVQRSWYDAVNQFRDFSAILSAVRRYVARDRHQSARHVAPRTAVEMTLSGIWGEVLGLEEVGIEDDFFASGGDSLLAVRVVAKIESVFGLELPLHEFFERPTVVEAADWLSQASPAAAPIEIADRGRELPLSWSQQRLWFIDRLEGGSSAYHIPVALRLHGSLDAAALEAALSALAQRHEILRTAFVKDPSGEPVQIIAPHASYSFERVDLRVSDQGRALEAAARETLLTPFDLAAGSLIRARLLKLANNEHLLLLSLHHMVADGWSIGVLTREVAAFYEARLRGGRAELPALRVQYADYACWQRSNSIASQIQGQVAYWREHLQGAPEVLDMPADHARPAMQSYRGANVRIEVEPALATELKLLSRGMNVTLAMTLYAAWSMLLARLSGQDDIVVGVPIANRRRTELEGLIGYFVNTLAVRVRLHDDPPVTDLLQRVKQIMLDAYAHQDAPFEQIVKALQPTRSLSHSPIFQVMLVMQNPSGGSLQIGDLEIREEEVPLHTAQFDLLLSMQESGAGLSGSLNFATDLFDTSTIERWIGCFKTLLQAMVRFPHMCVSALPLMDSLERRQVVEKFNATRAPFDADKTLHRLIEEQVERTPDGRALSYEGRSLTYEALNARANQLARYLRSQGIGPDQLVGICTERSIDMVVGLLGILKAGAAYVPIDPDYPAERLRHMLADSSPRVLLTQAHIRDVLPPFSAKVIALDAEWHEIAAFASDNLDAIEIGVSPGHLAYVIFTSGSTGKPKGAMNEHRALVNRLQWMQKEYGLTAGDRVLQKTPFSFDVSAWEFFWTLMTGACLVVARPRGHQDPHYLRNIIEEAGITTLHFVPSMLQVFLEEHRGEQCPSVRRVICSGEELPMSLQRRFHQCLPQAKLANLYGPTEAAIDVTYWECRTEDARGRVPIGRPIANVQMYVLDAHRAPVPVGVAGEIYIGGVGVGRGYLNRPELTAERFVADPFSNECGALMYKTGDLGHWRTDGAIEYLGRNDNQVKIRGLRIELGEIEAQLLRQPSVKEAVVVAREDAPGEKRLVAYVVLDLADISAGDGAAEALRSQLRTVLPEFMVPSAIVVLDRMPLSPNGKLERRALPVPDRAAFVARHYEGPVNDIEEIVSGVWQTLLRVERVGRHDNFFELGGHSLLIVQMMDRLRKVGLTAELRQVFESVTLASLASMLTRDIAERATVPDNAIPSDCVHITPNLLPLIRLEPEHIDLIVRTVPGGTANVQDIYPLSPLQEGLLFHHLLSSDEGDTYVVPTVLAVESRTRLDQLIESLQAVIDRHDVLRTSIVWEQLPQPVQVVHRRAKLPVTQVVLDPQCDLAGQLHIWVKPEHQRMNMQQAPLMQLRIAADPHERDRWYALLQLHHIIGDNTSQEMVIAEVIAHLEGRVHTLPPSLPYRDHVAQSLAHRSRHDAETFFRSKLRDVDEPTAPFGLFDVHGSGGQTEEASQQIDAKLASAARLSARRLGVSSATLFHAAWSLVVAHISGRDDVVFGSVLLGRLHGSAGAQRTLGMFINTLPLRLRLLGLTAQQLVERTQSELIELLTHEQASLAQAQRCSGVAGSAPLFTALLNYRHSDSVDSVRWSDVAGVEVFAGHERTNYPITLSVDDSERGLMLTAQTDKRVNAHRLVRCMHQAVASLVDALEQASELPALHLQVLPAADWHQVVREFNQTEAAYPREQTIHQLFEQQVSRTPGAVAVVYRGASLTYEQLNEEANRLAHHLLSHAITTGSYVPIVLPRSLLMLIAQLAVLKSGGVYVPVDPELPVERRMFMIRDCAAEVILSDGSIPNDMSGSVRGIDCADVLERTAPSPSPGNPSLAMTSGAPAYVLYTSGSTGVPKGVVVAHHSVNRLAFNNGFTQIGPQDCLAHYSNPAFDASTFEVWGALLSGARMLIVPQAVVLESERFAQLLKREGVTILYMSVGLFNQYTQALAGVFRDLSCLMVGGDSLDAGAIRRVLQMAPPRRLFNAYGPTECTTFSTMHRIKAVDEGTKSIPIGKPIANAQIYILDPRCEPVAVGVVGELYIGGAGVALGYLNRPELSGQRFVPDRFSPTPHAVMYRTGDLGRWREDGTIEFLGRNDQQVKVRGFRVELGEIEARLGEHEQIKEVSVLARQDGPGPKRLVAYFVPNAATAAPTAEQLRVYLKPLVPEYMVPSAFVQLERIPLTSSGKVDRRALPAPNLDAFSTRQYEAPQGELEEILCGIWQSLLNVEQVGRQDNFFELGGHSLIMVQMMERLRRLGLSVQVRCVFENPKLADLASVLSTEVAGQYEVPPNAIAPDCKSITPEMLPLVALEPQHIERIVQAVPDGAANIHDIYPLAPLQEGILFHHLLDEASDTYVLPTVLSLPSRERLQQLIAALQTVIDRHEVLRTAVLWEGLPRAVQVVYRHAKLRVEHVKLDPTRVQEQLKEWIHPSRQRLDIRSAPLLRLQVAPDPHGDQWYVMLQLHHMTIDHVSLEIVISEVVAQMEGRTQGLLEAVPYRNHVAQSLAYARAHDADAFFRSKLGDVEETTAPFGLLDVHGDGTQIQDAYEQVEPELAQRIRAQARRLGVSAATLFHSGWALVVAHTSGRDDVVFGTVLLGRLQGSAGGQRTLGMFINTLPVRLRLAEMSAAAFVEHTQRELVELLSYEQASLAAAQRCSAIGGNAPLFSALLNFRHSVPDTAAEWTSAAGVTVLSSLERTNYPVTLSVDDLGSGFSIKAQVDKRIEASRITAYLHGCMRSLTEALERAPSTPILKLDIIPEVERHSLCEFNATEAPYARERLVHQLFEEQALRTPDVTAIVDGQRELTYCELNNRANRLARHLRELGVGADQPVGVCMQRSPEMLMSVLGILKAGAAYLPLDPSYPPERLAYMLEDAAPRIVLTQDSLKGSIPREAQTVLLGKEFEDIGFRRKEDLPSQELGLSGENLLYLIYTSGSTGRPKGTAMSHRAMANLIQWHRHHLPAHVGCRVLQFAALSFDVAFQEIFSTLCTGGTLVLLDEGVRRDATAVIELLSMQRVERLFVPPLMLQSLADCVVGNAALPLSLRDVIVAGEQLRISDEIREFFSRLKQCRLHNHYGPTETHVVTALTLEADPRQWPTLPTIGRPVANTKIHILNRQRQPVPIGVAGEIYISGANLARGYLHRSQLTAERFVCDSFDAGGGARMYKTGDLGRWCADGTLEYLARNDDQVKIRGYRIELGEIEAQLAKHEHIKEAAVVAREDVQGQKRLVAYVTRRAGRDPSIEELSAHLRQALPDYMVPTAFVLLEALPVTPSGKLNRRALPEPDIGAFAAREYEPPLGEVEQVLAQIWSEVLGVDRIGRSNDFFELGGHSLLALKALVRMNQRLQLSLRVGEMYKHPTICGLALRITAGVTQDERVDLVREAGLSADIVAGQELPHTPAKAMLLTGATGFVGRFLLAELLASTDATIYCLVRASSNQHAAARLKAMMIAWDLWQECSEGRIVAVAGDLRLTNLGIDKATYQELRDGIDSIYHCATSMNHLETYEMAKPANVHSARALLDLALCGRPKLINHISTLGVFNASAAEPTRIVHERTSIDGELHLSSQGYTASKWVSEKIFLTAAQRGIPCNVFRLGLAWADSSQGRFDEQQNVSQVLKSALLCGHGIRNYRYPMPPTPVDYVARSIAFLGELHGKGGEIFHISAANQGIGGLFERVGDLIGAPMQLLSYYDWIYLMKRLHEAGMVLPAVPLIQYAFSMDEQTFHEHQRNVRSAANIRFDFGRTHLELERAGIDTPQFNDDLLRVCLEAMLARDHRLRELLNTDGPDAMMRSVAEPLADRRMH